MARRSGLGRGLSALIPPEVAAGRGSSLIDVPVGDIRPNQLQPRIHFDEESLAALAASIHEIGVLQPVLVRSLEDGSYELIAGERRWRAARRAGLQTIPALVRDADDASSLEQALVENLHREDLNPLEEAAAYKQLIEDFDFTHENLARRVGKSRAAISNALRLFLLPPGVQRYLADGRLSAGHARALLGTPDREAQQRLADEAVAEEISVRTLEEQVRRIAQGPSPEAVASDLPDAEAASVAPRPVAPLTRLRAPGVIELEELLSNHLDTRVKVEMSSKRGRVLIEFATIEDLERIYRVMVEGRDSHTPIDAGPEA